jgi:hypothetical protein
MLLLASSVCGPFKWRQFEPEVILLAVGWYLRFSLSYRDVEELLTVGDSYWNSFPWLNLRSLPALLLGARGSRS